MIQDEVEVMVEFLRLVFFGYIEADDNKGGMGGMPVEDFEEGILGNQDLDLRPDPGVVDKLLESLIGRLASGFLLYQPDDPNGDAGPLPV